ncbi:O-methyltransferase [Protofrankia symbiont of Coriaria ruscifolia]|uniref:O-methyltransferase n=1 Tax=Protofrankia symbiont of Coriaria ruscifolia TaxID=1306542 RepID=UPI0010410022|nr:O-methyltransferase [Protofrankia symbiont of Coriaria ruscifolia]
MSALDPAAQSPILTHGIYPYLAAHCSPPDELLTDLFEETRRKLGNLSVMQIGAELGTLLTILTASTGARRAIEVGTFTGYSSICIARGLPDDGHLLCCDVSEEWTSLARHYWKRAGLEDRIELRIGPAAATIAALPTEPVYDIALIDADKTSYQTYYDLLLPRMHPGGLILVDNVLQDGKVLDEQSRNANVRAIQAFNEVVAVDERVQTVLLAVSDGLMIARKL